MFKLIITVSGRVQMDGFQIREFKWSPAHSAHIYEGREFTAEEFNAKFEKAWRNNGDLMPKVRVVACATATVSVAAATPAAVPTATFHHTPPTLEEAEAIIQKLAPHRLKQKPGRKPANPLEV